LSSTKAIKIKAWFN